MCRSKANGGRRCGARLTGDTSLTRDGASDAPMGLIRAGTHLTGIEFRSRLPRRYAQGKVEPVGNHVPGGGSTQKPTGELWASPMMDPDDLPDGSAPMSAWDDKWNDGNPRPGIEHRVEIRPDARVLVIDSWADYQATVARWPRDVSHYRHGSRSTIDFTALAAEADAIWLTPAGCQAVRSSAHADSPEFDGMDGWDIPSVVILRAEMATVHPVD
jgi:hypothetical protein